MSLKVQLEKAVQAHSCWKAKFRDYLNGKTALDLSCVGVDDRCEFGMWLQQCGRELLNSKDYEEISRLHAQFHEVAAGVVKKIKAKDFVGARADISSNGTFNHTSHALIACLLKSAAHSVDKAD